LEQKRTEKLSVLQQELADTKNIENQKYQALVDRLNKEKTLLDSSIEPDREAFDAWAKENGFNFNVSAPPVKQFASGGYVQAPTGTPIPAIVHGGELILNQGQQAALLGGGGFNISGNFNFYGVQNMNDFMQEMRNTIKRFTGRTIYKGY
jgi:hypothetical protein